MGQLAESRSQAVDASAAELRRIERDLHDGAQARLVALGMNIGFAEQVLRDNPDLALTLLAEARASSGQALADCARWSAASTRRCWRNVASTGPCERSRSACPCPLTCISTCPAGHPRRWSRRVYFAIAEALANVVKHSGANRAWVQLEYDHGRLVAIVGDNGIGGAKLRAGGGLRGVERRLAAFDGVIAVTSPAGGPTLVTMELPCELSLART